MRKAQGSLEYLLTYGWGLILVASVVGVLAFVLEGTEAQPSFSSSDPTSLMLRGGVIQGSQAKVKLQNVTGGEIKITRVFSNSGGECALTGESQDGILVKPGGEIQVECEVPENGTDVVSVEYTDQFGFGQSVGVSIWPGKPTGPKGESICDDIFDNDGDGKVDCADPNCHGSQGTGGTCEYGAETTCDDLFDNDADGQPDSLDSDCAGSVPLTVAECSSSTTVLDVPGATYEMDKAFSAGGDFTCIEIAANEITLDCKNYAMRGHSYTAPAIYVQGKTGITIKNCKYITIGFGKGIYLEGCTNCTLSDNWVMSQEMVGIHVDGGSNVLVDNAIVSNTPTGFLFTNMTGSLTLTNCAFCEGVDTGISCENSSVVPTGQNNKADNTSENNCTIPAGIYSSC